MTSGSSPQTTPLHAAHKAAGGKLVDFAGWDLPVSYGSQIEEHQAVRNSAGMFDVSHMCITDLSGRGTGDWLRHLLANDAGKLEPGRGLYSCLCNEAGGVIDDLIVYNLGDDRYRLVTNAATRASVQPWLQAQCPDSIMLGVREDLAMLAVQGPSALELVVPVLQKLTSDAAAEVARLPRFGVFVNGEVQVARTGYTGEDGVEIMLPGKMALPLWIALLESGVRPAGLGARDTLRLEAGLALYGNELDAEHTPVQSGLGWTVDLSDPARMFIGREVLEAQKELGERWRNVGIELDGPGVLRAGQRIELAGQEAGVITSGTYSPSLESSIGLARVSQPIKATCDVVIRGKPIAAHLARVPFVKPNAAEPSLD